MFLDLGHIVVVFPQIRSVLDQFVILAFSVHVGVGPIPGFQIGIGLEAGDGTAPCVGIRPGRPSCLRTAGTGKYECGAPLGKGKLEKPFANHPTGIPKPSEKGGPLK